MLTHLGGKADDAARLADGIFADGLGVFEHFAEQDELLVLDAVVVALLLEYLLLHLAYLNVWLK